MTVNFALPVALLPLRGGSRGIPAKNIKTFVNQPLFAWCAKAALEAGLELFVSTDDDAIRAAVRTCTPQAKLIDRPSFLANDTASTESVISHALEAISCEHVVLLQATSPLTTSQHILDAIDSYRYGGCRPLVSGTRQHKFYWNNNGIPANYDPQLRPRRQDWSGSFVENGAFYIFSRVDFERSQCRCPPPCTLFEMDAIHAVELDTLEEWKQLEDLVRR